MKISSINGFGSSRINRKMEKAYRRLNPELANMTFPGGLAQAKRIINSIAVISNKNYVKFDELMLYDILNIYLEYFHKTISMMDSDQIRTSLKKHEIVNEKNVDSIIKFIKFNMKSLDYEVDSENNIYFHNIASDIIIDPNDGHISLDIGDYVRENNIHFD